MRVPLLFLLCCSSLLADERVEFFEKRVRPVLVQSCYPCHSAAVAKPMGGVRVDRKEGFDAAKLLAAVEYAGAVKMPPSGRLTPEQVADIRQWVSLGATFPTESPQTGGKHWAFQPVRQVRVPDVRQTQWVRSPVDAFILATLEEKRLKPAAPASRPDLLRRLTYDLTGLPPTPEELDAFEADAAPDAYAKVVDRLLASPHYGERWGRHWLDLVRYAETNGHEYDNDKLAPWRYRDYVIRAFNRDLPYDEFVREHIAGDLLPAKRKSADGATLESPVGTAFLWFGEVLNSATDSVKSRADEVDNQIDVMGKAFQGLTIACARCHDHKFDPIPTKDYYALAGVLHSTDLREASIDSPEREAAIRLKAQGLPHGLGSGDGAKVSYREGDVARATFEGDFGRWRASGVAFGDKPLNGAASSGAVGAKRFLGTLTSPKFQTGGEKYLHVRIAGSKANAKLRERGPLRFTSVCDGYKGQHVVPSGAGEFEWKTLTLIFERHRTCYVEIVDFDPEGYIAIDEVVYSSHKEPPQTSPGVMTQANSVEVDVPPSAFTIMAVDHEPRNVKVHLRGSHKNLGEEAPRGYLQAVGGGQATEGSGRLQVAEWIASPKNPLTARVMVNRIWKHHFGRGIVRSTDNFGATGDPPTHPELLDYLAAKFVESGWSVKAMHRLMVLSSTYMMSSEGSKEAASADPDNRLLSHMPVRRLEGEAIRDSMLAVSGQLNRTMFGPSIPPHISKYQDGRGKPESGPLDGQGRRSIYIQVRRNFLTPFLLAFDYPLPISSMGTRGISTVPSQALMMMNNEFVEQQAHAAAARAMTTSDPKARLDRMYREALGRRPDATETGLLLSFASEQQKVQGTEQRAWADVAHVLFNSVEFLYVR